MTNTESAEQRVMLADTLARLFRDSATTQAAVSEGWNAALWQQLQDMGLPLLLVSEAAGGIGGSWEDAQVVAHAVGAHAIGLPVCEAMIAHALAAQVGLVVPHALRLAGVQRTRDLALLAPLGGAALVVAADLAARSVASPIELPVGAVMALVGAPVFVWFLARGGR